MLNCTGGGRGGVGELNWIGAGGGGLKKEIWVLVCVVAKFCSEC